jgi:hypothetical protein
MFAVICLETGETIRENIASGQEAATIAIELSASTGKKHQPRRAKAMTDWRDRECKRFLNGAYTPIPFESLLESPLTTDHFVHVSTEEPGKVAFTLNAEHGEADRQTRMRPGRYFAQFCHQSVGGQMDDLMVRNYAARFAALYDPVNLQFASDEAGFEHVYTNGPDSCMSHPAEEYLTNNIHPVTVYAAGDIKVAFLSSRDHVDNEHITARCLVVPATKKYSRIYGDEPRLSAALQGAGYHFDAAALQGARLLKIMHAHDTYVVPYIDGIFRARRAGDHLVVDERGQIDCSRTDGLSRAGSTCARCEEPTDEDDMYRVGEEQWCDHCHTNHSFYCEYYEDQYPDSESHYEVYVRDSRGRLHLRIWSESAFDEHGFTCEGNGLNYHENEKVELKDGTLWCSDYFLEHGAQCHRCDEVFPADDCLGDDGESYCKDCAPTDCTEPQPRKIVQGRDENINQHEMDLAD